MAVVANMVHVHSEAPIERIIGQSARVLQRAPMHISSSIRAERIRISFVEGHWPESHARLNLYPIADGDYYLQLLYLSHTDKQPGNATVYWIEFRPEFFEQYPAAMLMNGRPFRFDEVREEQFAICAQSALILQQLGESSITEFADALKHTEFMLHLLRRAIDSVTTPFAPCPVPACRFLAYESEREKVQDARRVIEATIDQPLTIKELSRKVAMNECYLKKGFKALVGKTIHEYQQELRIGKAKELLRQQGQSVSDVANTLGYSSISHFSTAFKKATGMKPCELLQ